MPGGRRQAWAGGGGGGGGLLLLLAWACLALDPQQNCNSTQYSAHGKCCSRCPPGQKVSAPCSEDSDTACVPCQARHFQSVWTKERVCTPHRYCDQNVGLVVRFQGTASSNTICQCREGHHCSSHECQSCLKNQDCGPGEGVAQNATNMRDTICTECPEGFFSNISSATASCQRWSSCEAVGLVHKADGSRFSDTICEDAQKVRSGVWVPVAVATVILALGCVGLLLWYQRRRRQGLPKWHQNQPQLGPRGQDPEEDDEASSNLPIQETVDTALKDGEDSRLAEQKQV